MSVYVFYFGSSLFFICCETCLRWSQHEQEGIWFLLEVQGGEGEGIFTVQLLFASINYTGEELEFVVHQPFHLPKE